MESKLRLVLVVPNFRWSDWDINTLWHFIPYGLCLLAAMIEDICEVKIIDAYASDMSEDEFKSEIGKFNPHIVGITVLMDQYASAGHNAARLIKEFNDEIRVIMGGVYATVNPQEVMDDPNIDYVIIGEGEYVLRDFILNFLGTKQLPTKGICYREDGKLINTGHSDFIQKLDAIPFPAYHLIDFEKYIRSAHRKSVDGPRRYPYARIQTSRGCPIGCAFCQVESIAGRRFRARSAQNVLDEIQWLKEKYGVNSIMIDDDNFFTDKQRAKDILQGMLNRRLAMPWVAMAVSIFNLDEELIKLMKLSGCEYIDIAIESGSERILKEIIKKPIRFEQVRKVVQLAKSEDIYVAANFMIGFPTETWDEIRKTIKFAEEINVDYVKLFTVVPLRNTKLWRLCEKEGAFKKDFDMSGPKWSSGQIETEEFSANDLTVLRAYEWDRINFTDLEKRKRTAKMMGITEEELVKIRRKTLENLNKLIK